MTSASYRPDTTRSFYNDWGAREWDRSESSFENKINYRNHRMILSEAVKAGDRVLEVGAGPGRFTLEMTRAGAEVTVCDLSDVQLQINEQKVREADLAGNVTGWHQADVVDLSRFASGSFDVVVCVGSVLSCVLDRIPEAFDELVRLVRPGGIVIVSVTSRFGYLRAGLGLILPMAATGGQLDAIDHAVVTGDITGVQADVELLTTHFFTWDELREHLESRDCEVVIASASNFLSADTPLLDESLLTDPEVLDAFTRWEMEACRASGAIDAGTHMIVAARHKGE